MRTVLVLVLSLSTLTACGLRGQLERPVPLWGNPPDEGPLDPRNIRRAEEEAAAREAQEEAERAAGQAPAADPGAAATPPAQPSLPQ